MIIPDLNLLLYAYDSDSPFQAQAAAWWRGCWNLPPYVINTCRLEVQGRSDLWWRHPAAMNENSPPF